MGGVGGGWGGWGGLGGVGGTWSPGLFASNNQGAIPWKVPDLKQIALGLAESDRPFGSCFAHDFFHDAEVFLFQVSE